MSRYRIFYEDSFIYSDDNLPLIREALDDGCDPNYQLFEGSTPFLEAAIYPEDNIGVMQALISAGADVNMKSHLDFTALHFAVTNRKQRVVKALIEAGISVNAKTFLGFTALHLAVVKLVIPSLSARDEDPPDEEIINELLKHKDIDNNSMDCSGRTPLMAALISSETIVARKLLLKNANPNLGYKYSSTPLHVAFDKSMIYTGIQLLLKGANIYSMDKNERTPIDIFIDNYNEPNFYHLPLLKLIAFKYNITNDLKRKFQCIPELTKFLNKYCDEVDQMRNDFLSENITVHDFVLNCFNENQFKNTILDIYKPVVERLTKGAYAEYLNDILDIIPVSRLLQY